MKLPEENSAKETGEELCPFCSSAWGDINGMYCSNTWHLATPKIQRQLAELQEALKHSLILIENKNAVIDYYERKYENKPEDSITEKTSDS